MRTFQDGTLISPIKLVHVIPAHKMRISHSIDINIVMQVYMCRCLLENKYTDWPSKIFSWKFRPSKYKNFQVRIAHGQFSDFRHHDNLMYILIYSLIACNHKGIMLDITLISMEVNEWSIKNPSLDYDEKILGKNYVSKQYRNGQ